VLLRLISFCGLRPNEGRELQSRDIDFDKGLVFIRKNKSHKERYVALSDDVLRMCKNYQAITESVFADRTYFFPSPNSAPYGRRWLAKQFQMIWKSVKTNAGETNAVVYDLRHRYATTMMMKWLNEASSGGKRPPLTTVPGSTRIMSNFTERKKYVALRGFFHITFVMGTSTKNPIQILFNCSNFSFIRVASKYTL
jgi:integrase/recombinase XerD